MHVTRMRLHSLLTMCNGCGHHVYETLQGDKMADIYRHKHETPNQAFGKVLH